jgi:L-ascorbate metabolism protein UlaG (beta-lactamase superfamily)
MKIKNLLIAVLSLLLVQGLQAAKKEDTFQTPGGKTVVIHHLKHASIYIEYDGKHIYIDPVGDLEPKTDFSLYPKASILMITHEHFDHYDDLALNKLVAPTTAIYANRSVRGKYTRGIAMVNGDSIMLQSDIKIWAVPAYNITEGREQFHPKGRDNGYILSLDGLLIYIAGDTEDIPEMDDLKDIDIAFLPCNQPYTMTIDQLVNAAKRIRPKVLFPYHYSDTPIGQVLLKLNGSGIDVKIRDYK